MKNFKQLIDQNQKNIIKLKIFSNISSFAKLQNRIK